MTKIQSLNIEEFCNITDNKFFTILNYSDDTFTISDVKNNIIFDVDSSFKLPYNESNFCLSIRSQEKGYYISSDITNIISFSCYMNFNRTKKTYGYFKNNNMLKQYYNIYNSANHNKFKQFDNKSIINLRNIEENTTSLDAIFIETISKKIANKILVEGNSLKELYEIIDEKINNYSDPNLIYKFLLINKEISFLIHDKKSELNIVFPY
jgi:hypothetical protein